MKEQKQEGWSDELNECPDCNDGDIEVGETRSAGLNTIIREVWCTNTECTFSATEQFEHKATIRGN